ncbi:MAG: hypothetical protein AAF519_02425 [Bacteroidota bacterium]
MSDYEQDLLTAQEYLDGSLQKDELKQFEERLKTEPDLKELVNYQRKILAHLESHQKSERKASMLESFKEVTAQPTVPKAKSRVLWYAVAASAAILVAFFINSLLESSSNEDLFLKYYEPYDRVVITRGEKDGFIKGMEAYNSRNYKEALKSFENIEIENITQEQLYLLIGNCYLNLGNHENSLNVLQKIGDGSPSLIVANRDWYKAMALLKSGQLEKSKLILAQMVADQNVFAKQAESLLSENIFR